MADANLTLYAYTFRSRAERVIWTLKELNMAFDLIRLDPFKGERDTPAFRKLNPAGKVPVLVHGDRVLTESLAIMQYLDALSDQHPLTPSDPRDRYLFDRALSYGQTELEAYLWLADQNTRLKGLYVWPDGVAAQAVARVSKAVGLVSQWLTEQDFIAGPRFSLADILYAQLLSWAKAYDVPLPDPIPAYLAKVHGRPACPH